MNLAKLGRMAVQLVFGSTVTGTSTPCVAIHDRRCWFIVRCYSPSTDPLLRGRSAGTSTTTPATTFGPIWNGEPKRRTPKIEWQTDPYETPSGQRNADYSKGSKH